MIKIMQAATAVFVLGTCSTVIYAEEALTSASTQHTSCGELCTGNIPIELTVPKHCDLDVLTSKITLTDGGTGTGQFKVQANSNYNLLVSSTNGSKVKFGTNEIPITITTTPNGSSTNIPLGTPQTNIPFVLGGGILTTLK